jgi:hypothetical protein
LKSAGLAGAAPDAGSGFGAAVTFFSFGICPGLSDASPTVADFGSGGGRGGGINGIGNGNGIIWRSDVKTARSLKSGDSEKVRSQYLSRFRLVALNGDAHTLARARICKGRKRKAFGKATDSGINGG